MARYIDADALMEKLLSRLKDGEVLYRISPQEIDDAPTADVVEVVRCEDCRHCKFNSSAENYKCDRRGYFTETVAEDGYCSYGERKE